MMIRLLYLPHRLARIYEGQDNPLVSAAQQELAKRGFFNGTAGTLLDNETKNALIAFQEAERLSVTGILDPKTWCRLREGLSRTIEPLGVKPRAAAQLQRATITIARSPRQLTLFNGNTPIRQYPVAIGKASTPTPLGNYAIATKIPNPGGVLGTRWMGLNFDAYGIHGTNAPWNIGKMVSNGCIRMHNHNAEELFALIHIGTPVYIRD